MLKFNLINNYSHILVFEDNFIYSKENYSSAFRSTNLIKEFFKKYFNFFFNFNILYINFFFGFKSIDIFINLSYKNNRLNIFNKKIKNIKKLKNMFLISKSIYQFSSYNILKNFDLLYYNKFKFFKISGFKYKSNKLQFLLNYNFKNKMFKIKRFINFNTFYFNNFYFSFFNIFKNFLRLLCYNMFLVFKNIIIININKLIIIFFSIFFKRYNIQNYFNTFIINPLINDVKLKSKSLKYNTTDELVIYFLYLRLFFNYKYVKYYFKLHKILNYNLIYYYNYLLNFLFKYILRNKNTIIFDYNMFFVFCNFYFVKSLKINLFYFKFLRIINRQKNFISIKHTNKQLFSLFNHKLYNCISFYKIKYKIKLNKFKKIDKFFYKILSNKICFCFFDFSFFFKNFLFYVGNNFFNFKIKLFKKINKNKIIIKNNYIDNSVEIIFKRIYSIKFIKNLNNVFNRFRPQKILFLLIYKNKKKTFVFSKNKILYFIYYFYIIEKLYILCSFNKYDVFKQLMCFFFNKFKIFNNFFFKFQNNIQYSNKIINKNYNSFINIVKLNYRFNFYSIFLKEKKNSKNSYFDLNFYKKKYNDYLQKKVLKIFNFTLYFRLKNIYFDKFINVKNKYNFYIKLKKNYIISNNCFILKTKKINVFLKFQKIKILRKKNFCSIINLNYNNIFVNYLNTLLLKKNNTINKNLYLLNFVYLNNVKLFRNINFLNLYFKNFLYYLNTLFFKYLFYIISNFIFSSDYIINLHLNINLFNVKKFSNFLNYIFLNNNYINFLYFKLYYLNNFSIQGFGGLYFLLYQFINNSSFVSGTVLSNYIYYIFLQKFKTNKLSYLRKDLYILKNIFNDFLECNLYFKLIGFSIVLKGRLSKRSQRKSIFKICGGILSSNSLNYYLFNDKHYFNSIFGVSSLTICINLKNLNYNFNFVN